jgi:hypothetical protein
MKAMAVKILGNHRHIGLSPAPPIDEGLSDLDQPDRHAEAKHHTKPQHFTRPRHLCL